MFKLKNLKKRLVKLFSIDEKIIAGAIALLFVIFMLSASMIFVWGFFMTQNAVYMDAIKTIWAVFGTPLGAVLAYYFKSG